MSKGIKVITIVGWSILIILFVSELVLVYPPSEISPMTWIGVENNNGRSK